MHSACPTPPVLVETSALACKPAQHCKLGQTVCRLAPHLPTSLPSTAAAGQPRTRGSPSLHSMAAFPATRYAPLHALPLDRLPACRGQMDSVTPCSMAVCVSSSAPTRRMRVPMDHVCRVMPSVWDVWIKVRMHACNASGRVWAARVWNLVQITLTSPGKRRLPAR